MMVVLPGSALSKEVVVNFMIDFDSPDSPTPEQTNMVFSSIVNLTNAIDSRGLSATVFASGDMVFDQRLMVTTLGARDNHELALNGKSKDEMLGSMSASKQEERLKEAKEAIDSAHICEGKVIAINGFRPQSFDQNNDTYSILEGMGFIYDAGFKSGVLYLPGHENDTWPYPIENHNIYAVPVSTYNLSGERVLLSDKYIKEEKGLDGSKWYEILVGKFEEAANKGEPMVVILNNLVSGSDDYLDAYKDFIDYATMKNAKFVTTMELVNLTILGNENLTGIINTPKGDCPDCGKQNEEGEALSIGVAITHSENCTNCNETNESTVAPVKSG